VSEIAAALRRYGLSKIIGDRYAGIWPVKRDLLPVFWTEDCWKIPV
jgi:hypothetical protein